MKKENYSLRLVIDWGYYECKLIFCHAEFILFPSLIDFFTVIL